MCTCAFVEHHIPQPGESSQIRETLEGVQDTLNQNFKALSKGMILALRPITSQIRRTPSTAMTTDLRRDDNFKLRLVKLYFDARCSVPVMECPVTKLKLPSFKIKAGHIFPLRAHALLSDLCPDIPSINNERNGVLWEDVVEQGFELSCICFKWNEVAHILTPIVLDRYLLGKNMYEATKYLKAYSSSNASERR